MTAIVAAMIAHTPAARPSTPSEKLTTFIITTSPITVRIGPALVKPASGKARWPANGSSIAFTATPKCTTITAASTWPASFTPGCSSKRSSSAPTAVITAAASSTPCHSWCSERVPAGSHTRPAASAPAKIARPPSSGVGRSDRPRSRGSSIAPTALANCIVRGVSSAVTTAAARNAKSASSSVGCAIGSSTASQARRSGRAVAGPAVRAAHVRPAGRRMRRPGPAACGRSCEQPHAAARVGAHARPPGPSAPCGGRATPARRRRCSRTAGSAPRSPARARPARPRAPRTRP